MTILQTAILILRQQVKKLGFEAKLASIRPIQTPGRTVNQDKEQAQRALLQAS